MVDLWSPALPPCVYFGKDLVWMIRSRVGLQGCSKSAPAGLFAVAGGFGSKLWCPPWLVFLVFGLVLVGCGTEPPKPTEQAEKKPVEPAVPEEAQDAARALLGSDAQVLLYGDLAMSGKQQFLAANLVPKTPKSTVAGTVVTRAVIAENDDGKWVELMRADEYLKNPKGYLGLTPLQAVSGWKLQYENSSIKGLSLYFTPVKAGTSEKTLPIAVKWNSANKRYQSMDLNYEHFLTEAASLGNPRSMLR